MTIQRLSARRAAAPVRIELILIDLAAQSVAVNAQHLGRAGLVAVRAIQNALDEALFEFADRLFKKNSTLYHLTDESFQFVFHVGTLRSRTSCVQRSATNRAHVLPVCEAPHGTWRVWRRRPREEAPGRAGFSASE